MNIIIRITKQFLCIVLLLYGSGLCYGQYVKLKIDNTTNTVIYFRFDKSLVDSGYMTNASVLRKLDLVFKTQAEQIDSVFITATASPDGNAEYNSILANKRARAVKGFFVWKYPHVAQQRIKATSLGEDWIGLRRMVVGDSKMPFRNEVLSIIDSKAINPTVKEQKLKQVGSGVAWDYIEKKYLRYLRAGATCVMIYKKELPVDSANLKEINTQSKDTTKYSTLDTQINDHSQTSSLRDSITKQEYSDSLIVIPEEIAQLENDTIIKEDEMNDTTVNKTDSIEYIYKPLLAFKTNLLYDVATVVNIEVEVPIGKYVSIAGEYIFPWWTLDNGKANSLRHRLQFIGGNIEGKYWFGNRDERPVMTGWYAGLYLGGGLYDFEYKAKGYQGEFMIMGGLSGGYAHTINKSGSLRMEYSVGVGYMQTNYRKYQAYYGLDERWHPIRKLTGRYTWIGPTKAKISLVWLLNYKVKKEGGTK